MRSIMVMVAIMLTAATSVSAADLNCRVIKVKNNRIYKIRSALHKFTHIELPERFLDEPLPANDGLWDADGQGNHVMIKPNSTEPEGKETTLTIIGRSNTTYKFLLQRVSANPDLCVQVKKGNKIFNTNEVDDYRSPQQVKVLELEQQIADLDQQLSTAKETSIRRTEQTLIKYRNFIYTRYEWNKGTGFKGSGLVTDVYDDGRFTFIRLKPDNRGLLAVTAEIDGKMEMIEYKLDSHDIYKIAGIYPKFVLKYGQSQVTVKRKDNRSNGVY